MIEMGLLLFVFVICSVAYLFRLLTMSGAIAAFFVGVVISLAFGPSGLLILGLFFSTSSFLSFLKKRQKKEWNEKQDKGATRDWEQVIANGGVASISSILYMLTDNEIYLFAFVIALASANSDTWASEIGPLSRKKPISLIDFHRVDPGTSGAVSTLGTFAGLVASLLLAFVAFLLWDLSISQLILITVFGLIGNFIDTLLGAFIQARYECTQCKLALEKREHCQKPTKLIKGISWFNNEVVNFFSGLIATGLGMLCYVFFFLI